MQVLAWALYDLANTFFAIAMLSFHFPLWIVQDRGGTQLAFSVALSASLVCVALAMPFCGAASDATGGHTRFLRWTTYVCVLATAAVAGMPTVASALAVFAIANMAYQLSMVFYDALLWRVAGADRLVPASSIGAAFGYLGSAIGLCLGPTWATGRVLVMELAPKDRLGEMFGLAGLFARASSIVGPLLWGALVGGTGRYSAGLAALILMLAVGVGLLRRVPEPARA